MGKFRFLHWRSFGNTHVVPNSTVNTKQVVNLGIVGRRRWAIESHFLVVQWMDFFLSLLTVPFQTYDATFLYSLACPRRVPLCAKHLSVHVEMSVTSPVRSKSHRQTVGLCFVVADVDKHKKNRLFYVRFKLVKSASQIQFSKTHFLRPGSLTTTANLKQTCPNQHFPIPDQSQLTDLQTRQHSVQEKQLQMQGK